MSAGLKLVQDYSSIATPTELLVVSSTGKCRIHLEERDVPIPLIDLALHGFYQITGETVDAGPVYGTQMKVALPYIWQGRQRILEGAAVALLRGFGAVVPFGFFDGA